MKPQYCNFCQEMIYSSLCPFCERPASKFDYDNDKYEPQVDDGEGELDLSRVEFMSLDEIFGAEDD